MLSSRTLADNPNLFTGPGSLSQLDTLLPKYKNILLFNDTDGFEPCGAAEYFKQVESKLTGRAKFHYIPYTGKALPLEDVEDVYRTVKDITDADLIVAVGGGTVIDLAKIISLAYTNRCRKVEEILSPEFVNNTDPKRPAQCYIPTTAGTGSEATTFAVMYRDKVKLSIDYPVLLPDYTVLDPNLLQSLPEPVLNATLLDALAQAVESAWAKGTTEESREYSRQAIALIIDGLKKTGKENENNLQRLEDFQLGSHLAGKAINISRTTLPHSISYPMTSHFGIPHGIAVFLTLPKVAELNYHAGPDTLQPGLTQEHIQKTFSLLFPLFNVETIDRFVDVLTGIMQTLNVPTRLQHYGIQTGDLPNLAQKAITKGRSDNNPRKVDSETILNLLQEIY